MLLPRIAVFLLLMIGIYLLSSPLRIRANRRVFVHKGPEKPLDKLLYPVVQPLAKLVNLTSYKRLKLLNDLERSEIKQSPEEFYATAVVKALGMCILSAFFYFMGLAVPAICLLIASVLVYMQHVKTIDDRLKKKDEAIQNALPHFVGVIADMYKHDRNIAQIFESYLNDILDTPLRIDLTKAVALLNTNGNVPEALLMLDKAIGNQQLSMFLSALSEAYKGVDQSVTFAICVEKMRDMQLENIRRKTAQRPQKMQTVSFAVAAAIVLLFLVPLILQLFLINTLF